MLVLRIEFKDEILYYGVVNYNRSPQILEEIEKLDTFFQQIKKAQKLTQTKELLRLKLISGLTILFKDKEFSKLWK